MGWITRAIKWFRGDGITVSVNSEVWLNGRKVVGEEAKHVKQEMAAINREIDKLLSQLPPPNGGGLKG